MAAGDLALHVVNGKKGRGGGHRAKKGHRKNPSFFGGGGGGALFNANWMRVVWMLAGDLWVAWFTRRSWADQWGTSMLDGKKLVSPYGGEAWTLKNYILAGATGFGIARLLQRFQKGAAAADFLLGVKLALLRRILWTEGFSRTEWGKKAFGDITDVYGQNGAVWMATPGGYQQAMDGPNVQTQRWMLTGPEVQSKNWMMLGPGEEMSFAETPMGHAMVGPLTTEDLASYQHSGDADPYASSYAAT